MKESQESKEIQSLAGKIEMSEMGQKIQKSKPKKAKTKKAKREEAFDFRGGNVLEEKFDNTLIYRPKTKENQSRYENFLGKMYQVVEDHPQETLLSMADQVLAIILGEGTEMEKQVSTEAILGEKISHEHFFDLVNIAKSITDYEIENQDLIQRQIAIIDEEEDENQGDEDSVVSDVKSIQNDEEHGHTIQNKEKVKTQLEKNQDELDGNQIDAHWLQSQLTQYYDPVQAQQLEKQILQCLNTETNRQTESSLLGILDSKSFSLLRILVKNRRTIYYCTKYHQSENEKEKDQLLEEMKQYHIAISGKRRKKHEMKKIKSNEKIEQEMEDQFRVQMVKDEEIHRMGKKILDLDIHDSSDRMGTRQDYKFKLPSGAEKIEKPGYEEVIIPGKLVDLHEKLVEVKSLPEWMWPVFAQIKTLNPIQSKVCQYALSNDKNMLVCAPTSSGKTVVALLCILGTINRYRQENGTIDFSKFKMVYIAPMKALVAEITGNLSNRLRCLGINVRQLTGDMHLSKGQIEDTQIIVSTPEKWDIITRKAGDRIFTELVRLLIVDEIHLLSDDRGPVLESLIARTIRQSEKSHENVRIVGLSATLPNYKDVGTTLRVNEKNGLFYFDQRYRPVPLKQIFSGVTEKKGVRKMMMINEILYEKVMERVSSNQMIVFVHSRRDTVRTAKYLRDTAYAKNESHKLMKPNSESKLFFESLLEQKGEEKKPLTINNTDLAELLPHGIGIHHAGLSRSDRDNVEHFFADRKINVLVSTATLAWGVNLPAFAVIIKGTQVYSPQEGRWIELSLQDIMQMLGRAGRRGFDERGQGIIITGLEEVRYYLGLLNMQIPLESQMLKSLVDQLNAQIVLGSVNSLKDGVNWLSYTYLFIRMLKNPKHYSISYEEMEQDPELLRRRVNLIHTAATILQRNGLINYDRRSGALNSTFLGKIASNYYIKYPSMKIYHSNLKSTSSMIDLFKIFSMSMEFKHISVRDEEKRELQKLFDTVPVPIKGTIQDATTKISVLLQAQISKLHFEGFALNVDKIYITQSASRIMRGLFEISLKKGWGQVTLRCLEMAKMIDKMMWGCMNPLRQFKDIPENILKLLEKKEQFNWESFYQMNPQEIGDLIRFPRLGKIIHKRVHNVPRVEINAYAQSITRSSLRVDLTIKADFNWEDEFHGKEEPFWIFVLDCNEQNILFSYYFTLSAKQPTFYSQFIVPLFQILHPLYFIKVVSDRWISSDNILPLSFKTMILPNKFPAPQEVMDLQPIPSSSLPPIAKDLRISYLNNIQTQLYHTFMNTNSNIFVGSAEGTGKFTLALFAAFKCLYQEGKKVVFLFPKDSALTGKSEDLGKILRKKVGRTYGELAKDSGILLAMDVILTTPEAWDAVSRRWRARKGFDQIGLFVIENLHMLSEGLSTLEVVVSRMRYISSQMGEKSFRMIGLSTSVADYNELGQWMGATPETTFNFHPKIRQNNVETIFYSYDQHIRQSRLFMMQKNLVNKVKYYNRNCIIFVNDSKQMKLTALDCVSLLSLEEDHKKLRKFSDKELKHITKNISDQYLVHVLEYGIGYLYDGMKEQEKQIIINLFKTEGIGLLVVTQSLKWELALKAFMVVVLDVCYYRVTDQRWCDYSIVDMLQFMSFSSTSEKDKNRGKQYNHAKFIIMCHSAKKPFYKKFLFEPVPIESSLHLHLTNHLNSSMVSKSIETKQDCIDWLTWTFMYRRLIHNPNYYNMQEVSEEGISTFLSELIEKNVEYLENVKCLEVENQMDLTPTNLGIVCSYYYVRVETLSAFLQHIVENMKLVSIMEMLCEAEELAVFGYRHHEHHLINQILVSIHEKANNKAYGLMLMYLHRVSVSGELAQEIRRMLPIWVKLTHSLVDVITSFGYLKPLILTMQLCKMLVQAMWIDDSQLLQVMDGQVAELLDKQYGIKDIGEFANMDDEARDAALTGKDVNRIAEACNRYPAVTVEYEVLGEEDGEVGVKVTLARDDELDEKAMKVICPYYSESKDEYWWVLIGDKKTNRVLTTKRVLLLKSQATLEVQFQPIEGCQLYTLYALCDSYIGCDQVEEFSL